MDVLLATYNEMILSLNMGNIDGHVSVSKPLYIISLIEAIEWEALKENKIELSNSYLRTRFGQLYEQVNGNRKGYSSSFFIRPYYHLASAPFYHLVWKIGIRPPMKSHTPSAKYLRDNLHYAKLDDELYNLLQYADNREFFRRNIIKRYLKTD